MHKKTVFPAFALTLLLSTVLNTQFTKPLNNASYNINLTEQESQVAALVNGTNAYNYDLELEKIALNHTIADYSFRAAGSAGANETANWIAKQFESFGLETNKEPFQFTTWNLLTKPELTIYDDGNPTAVQSFQSEHYSWPTPEGGVSADLVVLPLPQADNRNSIGSNPINTAKWGTINTTGKIVLIGREVRWSSAWEETYKNKLTAQKPAAVVYAWWYDWMSFTPPVLSSAGGRPASSWGPYYWDLKIPVGSVSYEDGLRIRNKVNVSARVSIQSVIGNGPHYNVIGKLRGQVDSTKFVIASGHYDTVMDSGFCDNGAGTAGVIELARVVTEAVRRGLYTLNYTMLFIAFSSEELGLVGSTNYVMQHKAEMRDIVAVINLDSIGSDSFYVASTNPSGGLDLDELVLKAADDLNIAATLAGTGGSDQEVFRDPAWADNSYSWWWPGLAAGISDATPVQSSTMLLSHPIIYSDKWNMGQPGWIHTSYDNSTSTQTLGWVEPNKLEDQLKVATLSAMRVSSSQGVVNHFPFPLLILGIVVAAVIIAVTVVYFAKVRKPPIKNVVQ